MESIFRGADNFDTANRIILQTISKVFRNLITQTITTTADNVIGGMTITLTTKGTNSKFIIYTRWFGEANAGQDVVFNFRANGARINGSGTNYWNGMMMPRHSYIAGDDNSTPETMEMMTVISPSLSVGTSLTIDLTAIANSSKTIWTNRTFGVQSSTGFEVGTSELIIQEISA